jgi:hypothetical protein
MRRRYPPEKYSAFQLLYTRFIVEEWIFPFSDSAVTGRHSWSECKTTVCAARKAALNWKTALANSIAKAIPAQALPRRGFLFPVP